ncbi:VOC family protein [Microvirga brassicacearum]|uniref:VOC family protein n=1 Tax=Microvirga brassicacearum TaxID=2580413 RepID=A0A5N3P878_9HYPH|nr:VOC family protein [Microvirga brassicacearum]KAB0265920.1 VOC family protein [Microvirga brassicacearum]
MSDTATIKRPETAPALKGGVVPYLMLDGAAAAMDFYKRALGAEEIGERTGMDDGRICNARIDVNGGSIMLMDPMPEHGYPAVAPQAFNLHLYVDDADRWFDRAVAAGCTVLMPMELQFWGDRYGMVKDPYGVTWAFGSTPA